LACDLRIAGEAARMTTAFAKVGLSGDYGGTYFLTQLVGTSKARELYLTAETLGSSQLLTLGLVTRVVPDLELVAETMALAGKFAAGPRVAYRYIKRNIKVAEEGTLSDALDSEAYGMLRTRETADHAEAARAFVEKRPPAFVGR
jgi:2-(1,2-epoxy-1,2-dihydrophenyl)acetyl-CoA isomerase